MIQMTGKIAEVRKRLAEFAIPPNTQLKVTIVEQVTTIEQESSLPRRNSPIMLVVGRLIHMNSTAAKRTKTMTTEETPETSPRPSFITPEMIEKNPLLGAAGVFAGDPVWQELREEIKRNRFPDVFGFHAVI